MARNRVIYQSELLFVSEDASLTGSGKHEELKRVQSANYGFTISRQDINEYGQLAAIDRIVLDPPTVNLDFSYYLTDGFNEQALGFYVETGAGVGGFASGHLEAGSGRNLFITVHGEGVDAGASGVPKTIPNAVIGIGNAYLSDYTADFAVGSLPTVSVTMEGANINSDIAHLGISGTSITGIESPAINTAAGTKISKNVELPYTGTLFSSEAQAGYTAIPALRPGDVTLSLSNATTQALVDIGGGNNSSHVQNASISLPLSRSNLTKLGTKFDYAKVVDFPVTATMTVSAIVNEVTNNNLVDILDETGVDVTLTVLKPDGTAKAVEYTLKNVKVDSESFSSSIGSDKTVDLTFTTQIGSASDTLNGVFMSGANRNEPFNPAS